MPTRLTYKAALVLAVGLLFVSAFGARARSVGSIDRFERDASECSLVGDKLSKLVESPAMVPIALRAPDLHPITNTGKVFHADAFTFGPGLLYDAPADAVVYGLLETPLSSTEPLRKTLTAHEYGGIFVEPRVKLVCLLPDSAHDKYVTLTAPPWTSQGGRHFWLQFQKEWSSSKDVHPSQAITSHVHGAVAIEISLNEGSLVVTGDSREFKSVSLPGRQSYADETVVYRIAVDRARHPASCLINDQRSFGLNNVIELEEVVPVFNR